MRKTTSPNRTWSKVIASLIFAGFVTLIVFLDEGRGIRYVNLLMTIPYGDKWAHFFVTGSLSFFLNLAIDFRRVTILRRPVLLANVMLILFMVVEETTQAFNPYRHFEFSDILMNNTGILLFSYWARITAGYFQRTPEVSRRTNHTL